MEEYFTPKIIVEMVLKPTQRVENDRWKFSYKDEIRMSTCNRVRFYAQELQEVVDWIKIDEISKMDINYSTI